jgi:hypothetical protein
MINSHPRSIIKDYEWIHVLSVPVEYQQIESFDQLNNISKNIAAAWKGLSAKPSLQIYSICWDSTGTDYTCQ